MAAGTAPGMESTVATLSRLLLVAGILIVPSPLYSQTPTTTGHVPASAATLLPAAEMRAESTAPLVTDSSTFCCPDQRPCCGPIQSVFIFGGQFTTRSMGHTADVFNVTYDDNYIIGLGYQRLPWTTRNFYVGGEIGIGNRFGDSYSAELWGGLLIRHHGIRLGDFMIITPSLTAGFSTVTGSQGQELVREVTRNGEATFLYYLGPEIAISSPARPNVEIFYRLHHRCGGNGTLGHLSEGYNANVLGLRLKF